MPPPRSAAASSAPYDWSPHLGRKVSIRYRLHGDPEHPFSEAIGVVSAVEPDADGTVRVAILKRDGELVSVAAADILAAKIFPA